MDHPSQIHLKAVEESRKVDQINENLLNGQHATLQTEIATSIRFFGKNLSKLQECNDAILKLANIFLRVSELKLIDWSLRDSNAFLLMITSLLLKRKDENVVRQTCSIMKKFTSLISRTQLRNLVKIHQKEIQYILSKISKVSTYFTQMKLLEILHIILSVLDDGGEKVLKQDGHIAICSDAMVSDTVQFFLDITLDHFLHTSRNFLDYYNQEVLKSPFVFSLTCFLFKVNGRAMQDPVQCVVDFNLRNLSISFFVNAGKMRNSDYADSEYLVEVEDCSVVAEARKFSIDDYIELILKPTRSQILDENEVIVSDLGDISSLVLVVTEKPELFWSRIFPLFKDKTPMTNDNHTDMESLASFRTMNTMIENHERMPNPPTTTSLNLSVSAQESVNLINDLPANKPFEKVKQTSEDLFSASELNAHSETSFSAIIHVERKPKVLKIAQVKPSMPRKTLSLITSNNATIYDDIPRDEENLPPASQFLAHMRNQRQSQTQGIGNTETTNNDDPADLSWAPKGPKKATTAKRVSKRAEAPVLTKKPRISLKSSRKSSDIEKGIKIAFDDEVFEPLPPISAASKRTSRLKTAPKRAQKPKKKQEDDDTMSDGDMEVIIIKTIAESKKEAEEAAKNKKKAAAAVKTQKKSIPIDEETVQARRAVLTEIMRNEKSTKPVDVVKKKPRTAAKVSEFDSLLKEKESTSTRLARKRPACDDNDLQVKRSKIETVKPIPKMLSPIPSESSQERNAAGTKHPDNLNDSDKENAQDFAPFTQSPPSHNTEKLKFDYRFCNERVMLGKYINDVNNSSQIEMASTSRQGYTANDIVKNFQLSQYPEKLSPTIQIRNVQIQEIRISPQKDVETLMEHNSNKQFADETTLSRKLQAEAEKTIEPLFHDINDLIKGRKNPMKEKVIKEIQNCRSSKEQLRVHFDEHINLLKRLHYSKRKMTQMFDVDADNVKRLHYTVKELITENNEAAEEDKIKLEGIRQEALRKQEIAMKTIWKGFVDQIYKQVNTVLETHLKL